jgi:hypothetical protein
MGVIVIGLVGPLLATEKPPQLKKLYPYAILARNAAAPIRAAGPKARQAYSLAFVENGWICRIAISINSSGKASSIVEDLQRHERKPGYGLPSLK